jgi:hypothetical protein
MTSLLLLLGGRGGQNSKGETAVVETRKVGVRKTEGRGKESETLGYSGKACRREREREKERKKERKKERERSKETVR